MTCNIELSYPGPYLLLEARCMITWSMRVLRRDGYIQPTTRLDVRPKLSDAREELECFSLPYHLTPSRRFPVLIFLLLLHMTTSNVLTIQLSIYRSMIAFVTGILFPSPFDWEPSPNSRSQSWWWRQQLDGGGGGATRKGWKVNSSVWIRILWGINEDSLLFSSNLFHNLYAFWPWAILYVPFQKNWRIFLKNLENGTCRICLPELRA